jgi:hypothetical protein
MSKENLETFQKAFLKSTLLQEKLKTAFDRESFIKLAVELGTQNGYSFTAEEVDAALLKPTAISASGQFRVQSVKDIW